MPEFVRVKCKSTGHEKSIPASAPREGYEVLNKPATNPDGTALPDKHHVALKSLSSSKSTSGQKADAEKGN